MEHNDYIESNGEMNGLNDIIGTENVSEKANKVGQEQIHDLIFSDKLSWQAIIYDLINTEQLDPWDIDLSLLANRYLDKIRALEEASFFVSSKVLLAAALLLRIKSEILLNEYIPSLDVILFGKSDEEKTSHKLERIELDDEIPALIPKTPMPRFRKVTLQELMSALGKAINTENRRIKRVVLAKQYEIEAAAAMPKNTVNIRDKIREVYSRLKSIFSGREERLAFSELAGKTNEDKVYTFIPLLHLDNQNKIWLEQESHFEEIWILLKEIYERQNKDVLEQMKKEVEIEMEKYKEELSKEDQDRADKIEKDFDNPIGDEVF